MERITNNTATDAILKQAAFTRSGINRYDIFKTYNMGAPIVLSDANISPEEVVELIENVSNLKTITVS